MALCAKAVALSAKAGAPGECHLQALQNDRLEVEDLGIEVDRAEGARGDDDALELGKHWLHCQAGIQATQLQPKWCIRVKSGFQCSNILQGWSQNGASGWNFGFQCIKRLQCWSPNGASGWNLASSAIGDFKGCAKHSAK